MDYFCCLFRVCRAFLSVHLCVLIYILTKGEAGAVKQVTFSPPVFLYSIFLLTVSR